MNNNPISETEEMKELGEMIEKKELDPERTAGYAQGKANRNNDQTGGEILTPEQMADRLKISRGQLRKLYRFGKIPVMRAGYRTLRFNVGEVYNALEDLKPDDWKGKKDE